MRYLVTAEEMRRCDNNTQQIYQMDERILMERAALSVVEVLEEMKCVFSGVRVAILSGHGKNGGDGYAVARLLVQRGAEVYCVRPEEEHHDVDVTSLQRDIAEAYGVHVVALDEFDFRSVDAVVDAMFGIGCNRPLEGKYQEAVERVNAERERRKKLKSPLYVLAIDMPSGIHTDTGEVLGCAIEADATVTFNYEKLGLVFDPGCVYAGQVYIKDAGITPEGFQGEMPLAYTLDAFPSMEDADSERTANRGFQGVNRASQGANLLKSMEQYLPKRSAAGNKGTFGKALLVAGSQNISGAAILSGTSCLRMGAGMVRIFTAEENRRALQVTLPEALLDTYRTVSKGESVEDASVDFSQLHQQLDDAMKWSTVLCVGPGLGTGETAHEILTYIFEHYTHEMVLDADALNLISEDENLQTLAEQYQNPMIFTPHVGELSRLSGKSIRECKADLRSVAKSLADRYHAVVIAKDARSIVVHPDGDTYYVNTTGNSGMATAGSGDVLAGMVTALLAQKMDVEEAAVMGCFLHGLAGDQAAEVFGEYGMKAGDISAMLPSVF